MNIRIKGLPKEKQSTNGSITPFSSPYMQYGGSRGVVAPFQLDTSWDWMRSLDGQGRQNPYNATGKLLPEAEPGEGDIVVEKQEKIMGDFNGDGMPVLMGVNTGSHKSGDDQAVTVPQNSFVFSDTQNLKIKDKEILKQFGTKKPSTPAKLAKQFDLQKWKGVIDNPDSDDMDKRTAQYNYTNSVDALNKLATVQEQLKSRKNIPNSFDQSQQMSRYGGMYDNGGKVGEGDDYTVRAKRITQPFGPPEYDPYANMVQPQDFGFAREVPQITPVFHPEDLQQEQTANTSNRNRTHYQGMNPDQWRNTLLGMRSAEYPNYQPVRQVARGAYAQPVFLDPTRAKASAVEQTNNAAYNASISGDGPISRAISSSISGKAGSQIGDIEGQFAIQNAGIANQTNQQAAQTYNQLQGQQNQYNQQYNEDVSNSLKDRFGFNASMGNEYLKGLYEERLRKSNAHNYNYVNPFYTMDAQGFIHPKTKEQQAAVNAIGDFRGGSQGAQQFSPEQLEELTRLYKLSPDMAEEFRLSMLKQMYKIPQESTRRNSKTGTVSTTVRGNDDGNPNNQYGGKVKVRITSMPK